MIRDSLSKKGDGGKSHRKYISTFFLLFSSMQMDNEGKKIMNLVFSLFFFTPIEHFMNIFTIFLKTL